jgi:DNA-binding beta-propeller fold protein YncE
VIFAPVGAPVSVPVRGPFAAVAIDAQRRRVIAAGALSVAVLDADTGKLLATIRIGGTRSLAVEPLGGHIFAGTHEGRISEIDPDRKSVVRSLETHAAADELVYDAVNGRLYADGSGARTIAVIDARSFAPAPELAVPGVMPRRFVRDAVTRDFYVSAANRGEVAIVDPERRAVRAIFPASGADEAVLRFDAGLGQIVVVGAGGKLNVFDRAGTPLAQIDVPARIAACDLDESNHVLACTSPGSLTFVQLIRNAAPRVLVTTALPAPAVVALDSKTNGALVLRSQGDGSGAAIERWGAKNEGTNAAITNRVGLVQNSGEYP